MSWEKPPHAFTARLQLSSAPMETSAPETEIAAQQPPIPATVEYLIADYGKYVGLEGFAFDEENQIFLEAGGHELLIEYTGEHTGLLFQSKVASLPAAPGEALLSALLDLNTSSFRTGAGVLGLNTETTTLIWMDRAPLAGLTVESLDAFIDAAPEKLKVWGSLITEVLEPLAQGSTTESASTEPSHPNAIPV